MLPAERSARIGVYPHPGGHCSDAGRSPRAARGAVPLRILRPCILHRAHDVSLVAVTDSCYHGLMRRTRTCQHCGRDLSWGARSDAVYCGGACRVAAHRARHTDDSASAIPSALRSRARWVRHIAKRPVTVTGHGASVTNPRTWSTYAAARASTVGDGLGFVLCGDDDIIGIDIDHCIGDDGGLAPWAAAILDTVPATYIEQSPGGHGLHVFGFGRLPAGRVVTIDGGKIELYGAGRYLRMTGQAFGACPSALADIEPFIESLTM